MSLLRLATIVIIFAVSSCGGRSHVPYGKNPVNFSFQMNEEIHTLREYRGRPVMLFLVRISELTSELYMDEIVKAFNSSAGTTRFLVLSIAPYEMPLLAQYIKFNKLPFSIGTSDWSVASGQSELGIIPVVPSTYALDSDGRVVTIFAGVTSKNEIEKVVERMRPSQMLP